MPRKCHECTVVEQAVELVDGASDYLFAVKDLDSFSIYKPVGSGDRRVNLILCKKVAVRRDNLTRSEDVAIDDGPYLRRELVQEF